MENQTLAEKVEKWRVYTRDLQDPGMEGYEQMLSTIDGLAMKIIEKNSPTLIIDDFPEPGKGSYYTINLDIE